jgi:hypothetical protein
MIVREVTERWPQTIAVCGNHKVDFCCDGAHSIEQTDRASWGRHYKPRLNPDQETSSASPRNCAGKINDLIPLWLDAGVNSMFPAEIGTWARTRSPTGKDSSNSYRVPPDVPLDHYLYYMETARRV